MPVVAAAAIGAVGAGLASRSASKGQQAAAQASQQAADYATREQARQYDLSRADYAPYLKAGTGAIKSYSDLIGQNGADARQAAMAQFQASPDYNFRLNESLRALTARNAALGIQDSGAAQRSALTLAGNQASGEFNNYANRLASLTGVGQTAAQNNAALGQNYASAVGGIAQNNAQNLASSYQNQAAINGQLYQNLAGIGTGLIMNRWG